jgi:drug/metabolite transporter (DMT)-like permease
MKRLLPTLFVVLWATGFIGAGYSMPWAEPFGFLAVRFVIAFLILATAAFWLSAPWPDARQALNAAVAGALLHGLYLGGVFWAVHKGLPTGFSGVIVGLQPLITTLLAARVLGEKTTAKLWSGLALGFAGVAMVLAPRIGGVGTGVDAATLSACFLGVVAISAGTIWQKRFVSSQNLVTGTCWQYAGAALVTALAALAFETGEFTLTGELVFAMAWLVFVLSIGAIFLLMAMIREGEVSKVASLFYLVPAVTAVIAWALFGETLTPVQVGGMALAAAGVAVATRPARSG